MGPRRYILRPLGYYTWKELRKFSWDRQVDYHKTKEWSVMLRLREKPFQRENNEQWQMAEIQIIMKGDEMLDGFVISSHTVVWRLFQLCSGGRRLQGCRTMHTSEVQWHTLLMPTLRAWIEGSKVWRSPGLHSETLSQPSKHEAKQINRKRSIEDRLIVQGLPQRKLSEPVIVMKGEKKGSYWNISYRLFCFFGSAL